MQKTRSSRDGRCVRRINRVSTLGRAFRVDVRQMVAARSVRGRALGGMTLRDSASQDKS